MPDVQSVLLALYQQILGVSGTGPFAREQSSLEAAAAARVMTSGLTIGLGGSITISGLTIVGTTTSRPLSVVGSEGAPSGLVATLYSNVLGRDGAVMFSDLGGTTVACGYEAATQAFAVWQGRNLGVAGTKVLQITPVGTLTVFGAGAHALTAADPGQQTLQLTNTTSGPGAFAGLELRAGGTTQLYLRAFSPGWTGAVNPSGPDVVGLLSVAPNGLNVAALSGTGPIRFYTGGGTQRWIIDANGHFYMGTPANGNAYTFLYQGQGAIELGNAGVATTTTLFFKNANGLVGSVATTASATAYNTSSDARLKRDRGIVKRTTVLRDTVIHDFEWLDGVPGRGVFAQEAAPVAPPHAITEGTDARDADGHLTAPWQADYSKYIPDLIVGWQQHEAEIAKLRAQLAERQ